MIALNISELDDPGDKHAYTDMTVSCPAIQVLRAQKAIEDGAKAGTFAYGNLVVDTDVAKDSVVGIGMRSHARVEA